MFKNIKINTAFGNSAWMFSYRGSQYGHEMETEDMVLVVQNLLDTMKKLRKRDKKL